MYLIVITRKKTVGNLLGHAVWKAMDFDIICYKKTVLHLSEIQVSTVKPGLWRKESFYNLVLTTNSVLVHINKSFSI